MTITAKLLSIMNIKTAIKNAITTKGGAVNDQTPFVNYPNAILNLPNQPDPYSIVIIVDYWGYPSALKMGSATTLVPRNMAYESLIRSVEFSNTVRSIEGSAFKASFLEKVEFSQNIVTVGTSAFAMCTRLLSIKLNEGLQVISSNAFEGCTMATGDLTIPQSVVRLSYACFSECRSLLNLIILSTNLEIESNAFYNCVALRTVTFSSGVNIIASYAFSGCSSLTAIYLPDNITSLGIRVFEKCLSAISLRLSESLTLIPSYAFSECSKLSYVKIPNTVTRIADFSFNACAKLKQIDIGVGVTTINAMAFAGCAAVEIIRCYAVNPPTATTNVFNGVVLTNIKLYVPDDSVNVYKTHSYWSYFNVLPMSSYVDMGYVLN